MDDKVDSYMRLNENDIKVLRGEISFKTFIISGAGGQNLQKSSTGAALHWDAARSHLSSAMKERIFQYLERHHLPAEMIFRSQNHRSLDLNKKESFSKLLTFIEKALFVPKKRLATKPTYSSKVKKRETKKIKSNIKKNRQKVSY